jgi:deazaflavin-dependent oxidoreductase (nitroreductase family)
MSRALGSGTETRSEYEASGGAEGTNLRGVPVVVITSLGSSSGKLRTNPVMRVGHACVYAAVAYKGAAPEHPAWYRNVVEHPLVELQDERAKRDCTAREVFGEERASGASAPWRSGRTTPSTRRRPTGRSRCLCWSPRTDLPESQMSAFHRSSTRTA